MGYDWSYNWSSTIFSALSDSIATNFTGPRQSFQPYRLDTNTRYQSSTIFSVLSDSIQNNIIGPRQTFQSYRTRYKQHYRSSTILSTLSDSIQTKLYRSSTILSALSDSIQITITGPRQSFQPYRTRYKQTLPVLDNLFSLIGLDTNER